MSFPFKKTIKSMMNLRLSMLRQKMKRSKNAKKKKVHTKHTITITRETIQQKNWELVLKAIQCHGIDKCVYNRNENGAGNILHLVLQYDPPLRILKHIVDLLELEHEDKHEHRHQSLSFLLEPDDEFNKSGIPLHVAIAYGASYEVINFLVDRSNESARCRDIHGQSPLHLACSSCSLQSNQNEQERIISKLISVAPEMSLREDNNRKIPIELAFESGCCSNKALSTLNDCSQKQREIIRQNMMVCSFVHQ